MYFHQLRKTSSTNDGVECTVKCSSSTIANKRSRGTSTSPDRTANFVFLCCIVSPFTSKGGGMLRGKGGCSWFICGKQTSNKAVQEGPDLTLMHCRYGCCCHPTRRRGLWGFSGLLFWKRLIRSNEKLFLSKASETTLFKKKKKCDTFFQLHWQNGGFLSFF